MNKIKMLNFQQGVGKESGRPWSRITLSCDSENGRSVADFFVSPEVAAKAATIPFDSTVIVESSLDQKLHFAISDIKMVAKPSSN